jgi:general secretion pathway protein K
MTEPVRRSAVGSSQRGFVLVAVLWILAALAALAVIFSVYLSNSARALALNDTTLQAQALVSAGVELAAYRLQLAGDEARPAHDSFRVRLNGAEISVSFVSEAARIDLNAAPKELLAGLLSVLGANEDAAKEGADRIVAWRTKPAQDTSGNSTSGNSTAGNSTADSEDALYQAAGRGYSPRQAPFAHVNELGLVLGLTPTLVERALPFVTIYSRASGVDVLVAAPEVIAALPGMTPLTLKQFLEDRATLPNDPTAIATALGGAQASATTQKSRAYRILTRIRFQNGRETASEIVIDLRGKEEPYRVLSWQDNVPLHQPASREL